MREVAARWLEGVRARSSRATVRQYEGIYRRHVEPALGDLELESVSRRELRTLVLGLVSRGLDPSMLVRVLSLFFGFAVEEGLLPASPAQRLSRSLPRRERSEDVKAFTKPQLALFLEVSLSEPAHYHELFRTMAFAGLRSGEARALVASDVHELARKLDVCRTFSGNDLSSTTKTKSARRVEIPRELAARLGRRARELRPGEWLFSRDGRPLLANALRESFRRILKRAGLPAHHGTHSLRHTYASHLLAQGVPIVYVQRQLGHRSIRQTVDVYGRWTPMSQTGELERLVLETAKARPREPKDDSEEVRAFSRVLRFRARPEEVRTSCSSSSDDTDDSRGAA